MENNQKISFVTHRFLLQNKENISLVAKFIVMKSAYVNSRVSHYTAYRFWKSKRTPYSVNTIDKLVKKFIALEWCTIDEHGTLHFASKKTLANLHVKDSKAPLTARSRENHKADKKVQNPIAIKLERTNDQKELKKQLYAVLLLNKWKAKMQAVKGIAKNSKIPDVPLEISLHLLSKQWNLSKSYTWCLIEGIKSSNYLQVAKHSVQKVAENVSVKSWREFLLSGLNHSKGLFFLNGTVWYQPCNQYLPKGSKRKFFNPSPIGIGILLGS